MHNRRYPNNNDTEKIRHSKSPYTAVKDTGPKNVELSLEVEVDDEVRSIIKNSEISPSTLLDVTVIKPKDLNSYTTNTQILKSDQVKHMLESMQLDSDDKKTLMDKLFGGQQTDPKRNNCTHQTHPHTHYVMEQADESQKDKNGTVQHIYTSPRTFKNIRTMFECQNKAQTETGQKPDKPCLCQNCAVVGVLNDSQKKPFATEPMPEPEVSRKSTKRPSKKRSVSEIISPNLLNRSHEQCHSVLKDLSVRINELEKRITQQEKRAVPKEYFKKIITKLVAHVSKLTHSNADDKVMNQKIIQTDPSTVKTIKHKYCVNPILLDTTPKFPAEREYEPQACSSSSDPPRGASETIWKWGEDFVSCSKDLKNKVVVLLEETLYHLKKGFGRQTNNDCDDEIQKIVDELARRLEKTVRVDSNKTRSGRSKLFNHRLNNAPSAKTFEKRLKKPSLIPRYKMKTNDTGVKIAYVNPQLTRWSEEEEDGSAVSFHLNTTRQYHESRRDAMTEIKTENQCLPDHNDTRSDTMTEAKKNQYKREFYKVLENTKPIDRYKLWENIWTQAVENRQTKTDTVLIQIPDPNDTLRQKMIHLEYTIGEMEKLLLRDP